MSRILEIFDKSLAGSKADQTELVCESEEFYLSRFAENKINANIGRTDRTIWCRAVINQKTGIAKTNILTQDSIDALVRKAAEICSQQHDDPQFGSLVMSQPSTEQGGYFESTATFSAQAKAEAIKSIVDEASRDNLEASGIFQTSAAGLAVANSLGTRQEGKTTEARFSITLSEGDNRSGYAQAFARDVDNLDFHQIAGYAIGKASMPSSPIALEPGPYTVILEPEAVADFLLFLGFLGFGGKGMVSGRGFMSGKVGEKIMSEKITISEDPYHPVMSYMPFDYEGVPRKKVALVDQGLARGAVYNSYYAALGNTESTGNALPPDNGFGPYPKAMVMEAGIKSLAQIIESSEKAVFINHFWYVNYVNPMRTLVTGTTRDGTFLVENGRITSPVKDMRLMQSMLEAFSNVEEISSERRLVYKYGALMYVPAIKISNFNFVSSE